MNAAPLALSKYAERIQGAAPAFAWPQIAGLRNRIVHDYAGIDLKLVWNISQTAIPKLALQVADLK
jgi:uncharacterized protein with HEPN domain